MKNKIIALISFFFLAIACVHEPFLAPPQGMGNDTIHNPVDTSTNPIDTTNQGKACDPDSVYFERDILPILISNCAYAGCHDATTHEEGIVLNNYQNVMTTGEVRPGKPSNSKIYKKIVDSDPGDRMPPPPNSPLSQAQKDLIRKWIEQGAKNLHCDECDTTALTYTNGIKAVFDQNCISCHSGNAPTGGRKLSTYTEVKDALLNTSLLIRINGGTTANPVMPQGGKMNQCNIRKIEVWYNNGMPQ